MPSAIKRETSVHPLIQAHLTKRLDGLPSTGNTPRTPPELPRRWRSRPALEMHRRKLENGPLTPHLNPELLAWLSAPEGSELSPHLRLGMEGVSLFHSWCDRYLDRLREPNPADLLG